MNYYQPIAVFAMVLGVIANGSMLRLIVQMYRNAGPYDIPNPNGIVGGSIGIYLLLVLVACVPRLLWVHIKGGTNDDPLTIVAIVTGIIAIMLAHLSTDTDYYALLGGTVGGYVGLMVLLSFALLIYRVAKGPNVQSQNISSGKPAVIGQNMHPAYVLPYDQGQGAVPVTSGQMFQHPQSSIAVAPQAGYQAATTQAGQIQPLYPVYFPQQHAGVPTNAHPTTSSHPSPDPPASTA